jgi:hypothetical protein
VRDVSFDPGTVDEITVSLRDIYPAVKPSHPGTSPQTKEFVMFSLFRAITDRLKALFVAEVAMEFEAELMTRDAERRAELHGQADRYDAEGLHGIADRLRKQAEELSLDRPLASVLPSLEHWQETPGLPGPSANDGHTPELLPMSASATDTSTNGSRKPTSHRKRAK